MIHYRQRVDPPIMPHPVGHHSSIAPGPPPIPGMVWTQHANRPGFYSWAPTPTRLPVQTWPGMPGAPTPGGGPARLPVETWPGMGAGAPTPADHLVSLLLGARG